MPGAKKHTVPTQEEDLLAIPWFLDCKNPEVIARRAEGSKKLDAALAKREEERKFKFAAARQAKSVKTDPAKPAADAPVKPAPVTEPAKRGRPSNSRLPMDGVIVVNITANPHKPKSQAYGKTQVLLDSDGMTVEEYCNTTVEGAKGKWQKGHLTALLNDGAIAIKNESTEKDLK